MASSHGGNSPLAGGTKARSVLSRAPTMGRRATMPSEALRTYRGFNFEVAERIAPTWASRREQIEGVATPVREWLLRELGANPGDTVLELAAGTGDTGFEVAQVVGARGRLITSDFSPNMLETARTRGA